MAFTRPWTQDEINLMVDMTGEGFTASQIAISLNRTEPSVHTARHRAGITPSRLAAVMARMRAEDEAEDDDYYIAANTRFCDAMIAAIKSGDELLPMRPARSSKPFRPVSFHPEPIGSGCSSSAASCAEAGDFAGAL